MDKSKSFPYYSSSYAEARFDFEDRAKSYSFNGPGDDPEVKRRKRVAGYNMYAVEDISEIFQDQDFWNINAAGSGPAKRLESFLPVKIHLRQA
ncbi:UNVERIFIED_CONTAM: hypothetical protein Scaly_0004300 [Sesamum calycinum]|uniref:Uncharacterized protein n=1 Tax=Sesamum calycinum TaxID=2727403 RepID=A0AAW2SSV6_9LAMI